MKNYIALATLQYPVTEDEIRASAYPSILPAEMDDELLADLGFARVETVEPPELGPRDTLTELPPELIEGVWRQRWSVTTEPEPAPDWPALIAERRWQAEIAGIEVAGMHVDTDDRSKLLINGAALEAMLDPDYTLRWKTPTGFVDLSAEQVIAVARAVRAHVEVCFAREDALLAALEASTFTPEMLDQGWPA